MEDEKALFAGRTLLITGGTGSFGNAVLKRFLKTDIGQVRIFSRDEKKQDDMRRRFASEKLKFFIGDVRDSQSVMQAMRDVDYVFHAAALKQVPSCEFFPMEAVRTNIIGTENVLNAAITQRVKRVICLSTDKAVYPINAMGISKALMEKLVTAKSRENFGGDTVLCCTRYGNVLLSRGSVVPLFAEQIKTGQPLTVTNPDMTRFLMSLDEAVELVLYAFKNARQGDIFIQKSPASTILDLAQTVKSIFHADNLVRIIGIRHGEKLYEALLSSEEFARAEDLGEYYRVPLDSRDLNYTKYFDNGEKKEEDTIYSSHNAVRLNCAQIEKKLLSLPDFQRLLKGAR